MKWKLHEVQIPACVKFYWNIATLICLGIIDGCVHASGTELSSRGRDHMACSIWNVHSPALFRKHLLTSGFAPVPSISDKAGACVRRGRLFFFMTAQFYQQWLAGVLPLEGFWDPTWTQKDETTMMNWLCLHVGHTCSCCSLVSSVLILPLETVIVPLASFSS